MLVFGFYSILRRRLQPFFNDFFFGFLLDFEPFSAVFQDFPLFLILDVEPFFSHF